MPSISSSPQEEVGQSHLSRPMVNPVFTVTSVKRTPWRTPCVRALCESCRLPRTSVNIHTVLKHRNRLETASEDARGAEISCRPVVMIRDSCLVTVLCLRGAA